MKQPDLNEMYNTVLLDHELQLTINDLDKLDAYIASIISANKLSRIHIVGDGENLRFIAEKYYGSQSYWTSLGKYNGLLSSTVTKGTELVVPEKGDLDNWLAIQK